MNKIASGLLLLFCFVAAYAQQDSIYIRAKILENRRDVTVHQNITYYNNTKNPTQQIKLLNWISAYKNRNTSLLYRKLEDRKKDLYFAKPNELGQLKNLSIQIENEAAHEINSNDENLLIKLNSALLPGEKVEITLDYDLQLPSSQFTGYGSDGKKISMKYFFIVPAVDQDHIDAENNFEDIEENESPGIFWTINLDLPANLYAESNLQEKYPLYFHGRLTNDPELIISDYRYDTITTQIEGNNTQISFGYPITAEEKKNLEFYLPLQLSFIKNTIGFLPEKIFISEKFRANEDFMGIDDIRFWKFTYRLFDETQKTDLNYFSILSKNIIEQSVIYDKNEDHWWINGMKTYLEISYLQRYYRDEKLLGKLPEHFHIFGLKPLKLFYASKLKLRERYGLAYQYIMTQNLDQKIDEPFRKFSNFNATAISHFETGSLFAFVAEKMGKEKFEDFTMSFMAKNKGEQLDKNKFLDELSIASNGSSEFLKDFFQKKNRVNFSLKRYQKSEDNFDLKITKNTPQKIPFKVNTYEKNGNKKEYWFDTDSLTNAHLYEIKQSNADKIVINDQYVFPENNFRDNYLYTRGLFANAKKIKLKFFKDIPNPEFNEVYLNPRLNFNAYDKILLGLNFRNTSLFNRKFVYSVTPYYSSGTRKLTGSGGVAYSFQPAESFFRSLDVGISGSYFHYDYNLNYKKLTVFGNFNFSKNPRSDIGRTLSLSYNHLSKDLNPRMIAENEYANYNLWNIGYGYYDQRLIHEKYLGANLQWMEDFQKVSGEAFYRWEFAKDKKISLRFFGGYFISNKTKNNSFDYGISRVSNYAFTYGLLGQSATSGILSQQLIIAEGGFKSYVGNIANQWITSVNVDTHVWRWFNVYADAGVYKNKSVDPKFIWDSGVKLKVIPDFLEVYFPIQSSLGFEPSFKDYQKRIRFTLNLNFSAITNYFRRGWF